MIKVHLAEYRDHCIATDQQQAAEIIQRAIDKISTLEQTEMTKLSEQVRENYYVQGSEDFDVQQYILADEIAALEQRLEAAYLAGYETAHNHTVEGAYSPEQSLEDYMKESDSDHNA